MSLRIKSYRTIGRTISGVKRVCVICCYSLILLNYLVFTGVSNHDFCRMTGLDREIVRFSTGFKINEISVCIHILYGTVRFNTLDGEVVCPVIVHVITGLNLADLDPVLRIYILNLTGTAGLLQVHDISDLVADLILNRHFISTDLCRFKILNNRILSFRNRLCNKIAISDYRHSFLGRGEFSRCIIVIFTVFIENIELESIRKFLTDTRNSRNSFFDGQTAIFNFLIYIGNRVGSGIVLLYRCSGNSTIDKLECFGTRAFCSCFRNCVVTQRNIILCPCPIARLKLSACQSNRLKSGRTADRNRQIGKIQSRNLICIQRIFIRSFEYFANRNTSLERSIFIDHLKVSLFAGGKIIDMRVVVIRIVILRGI